MLRTIPVRTRQMLLVAALCFLYVTFALGQSVPQQGSDNYDTPQDPEAVTLIPHSNTSRYWISGQDNVIFQWHPSFPAKYSGPNSLRNTAENATSNVATLYLGYSLTHTTEVFVDFETADGGGLSDALGLAGFTGTWLPLSSRAANLDKILISHTCSDYGKKNYRELQPAGFLRKVCAEASRKWRVNKA